MFIFIIVQKTLGKKMKASMIIIEYVIQQKPKMKKMTFGIGLKVPKSFAFSANLNACVAEQLIQTASIPPTIGTTYPTKTYNL